MALSAKQGEHRAEAVRVPEPTQTLELVRARAAVQMSARRLVERRSIARGLLLLAVVVLGLSVARAGLGRVFVPGWWRQW